MPSSKRSPGKLRALHLAAVIFLTVSGGPYGLEPLFSYVGNHGALVLLLVTPLLWDVPTILTVLELNSLMPTTGGYYQWVKRALGLRWAFFEGWWTWLYTFCDLAIYPVLFVGYAAYFFPEIAAYKIPCCFLIIWSSALLNIFGIVPVGRTSLVLTVLVLVPFFFAFGMAFLHPASTKLSPHLATHSFPDISLALYTVMWNFIGWDNATTYAGEVSRPIRSYVVSVCMAFLITVSIYVLATLAVARSGVDALQLKDAGFPLLGEIIGGHWLGMLIAAGGMASTIGLYSAVLLSVSRVPQVMGDDKLLPAAFCTLHARFKTPYISIITSSLVVSVLVLFTFSDLIIMDIILYGAGLALEFLALLILRAREPNIRRPFRIPLGKTGLVFLFLLPVVIYTVALTGAIQSSEKIGLPLYLAIGMLFSPAIVWPFIRRRHNKTLTSTG